MLARLEAGWLALQGVINRLGRLSGYVLVAGKCVLTTEAQVNGKP